MWAEMYDQARANRKPLVVEDAIQHSVEGSKAVTIEETMDYAAFRCFDVLLDRLTPLVEAQRANAEDILGIVTILRDEYRERYEAHR